MKTTDLHPTRAQLIAAVRSGGNRFRKHLAICESCRELFQTLRQFDLSGESGLTAPPQEVVERWRKVPMLDESVRRRPIRIGTVGFDSWRERPTAVRDIPDGLVRRLRLDARDLVLEIVGEQRKRVWHFIARVYRRGNVVGDCALSVGRLRLLPAEDGFYTWSMHRPPRKITLRSAEEQVKFEALSW